MPLFEYRCQSCGHVAEFLEKGRARNKHVCPQCKSPDLKKLPSGFAVGRSPEPPASCPSCPGAPCSPDRCGMGDCPMG
ncbi:MAG: zinc ribbon domain-containing protein [Phycisphaerae bacterium]|nr:zinc ribbon domain-containing protein [Phycisphaerae bacterium]